MELDKWYPHFKMSHFFYDINHNTEPLSINGMQSHGDVVWYIFKSFYKRRGPEYLYIFSSANIWPLYVLIRVIDYLTFTAVAWILNTGVHLFFLNELRVTPLIFTCPFA